PPFFRGLFFQRELLPTQVLIGGVFLLYWVFNRKERFIQDYQWLDYGLIALACLYSASVFYGVNKLLSLQEALKYIAFFLILLLSRRIVDHVEKLYIVVKAIVLAGVLVVLIGTGAALEWVSFSDAFVGGMMNSTFQYHNTFGIYCLALLFLAYMLGARESGPWKHVARGASFILFFGFILSYSRGAWILLPPLGVLYYILVPIHYKKSFIADFIGNFVALAIVINPFTHAINKEVKGSGALWFVLGILVSMGIAMALERIMEKLSIRDRFYNIAIPSFTLVLPIILFAMKDTILGFLPEDLADRMANISLGTETVTERTVFYQDAFKIIKDYPLFGTGGGGWGTLYRMYQSYGYASTQAHNYYMQLWIEVGTIGLLLLGIVLLLYVYHCVRNYYTCEDGDLKAIHAGLFIAVAALLGHSAIDFNMALAAIPILIWGIIGMQMGISQPFLKVKVGKNATTYGIVAMASILLIISSFHTIAMNEIRSGISDLNRGRIDSAMKQMKSATKLNPLEPTYIGDYATIANHIAVQAGDEDSRVQSIKKMDKAMELAPYDFNLLTKAVGFYFGNDEIDKAFKMIEQLEKYHPLNSSTYESVTGFYLAVAQEYAEEGKKDEAVEILQRIVDIEGKIDVLNQDIKDSVQITNMVRFVEVTAKTQENIEKARELLSSL
ncbi:MAG: O-antigen ligase family protein, partial [Thermotaleaceae bacterium]